MLKVKAVAREAQVADYIKEYTVVMQIVVLIGPKTTRLCDRKTIALFENRVVVD